MFPSLEQRVRLLARQFQRFHEETAGSGRPNSRIIQGPNVKLAAALEPIYGLYESGDTKATNELWPFYWQLQGKGKALTRDVEWFRHMGRKLLQNGKLEEADKPECIYEEEPKHNWDDLYGPPAALPSENQRQALCAETSTSDAWPRQNEKTGSNTSSPRCQDPPAASPFATPRSSSPKPATPPSSPPRPSSPAICGCPIGVVSFWPRSRPNLTTLERIAQDSREYLSSREVKKAVEPLGDGDLIATATTSIPINPALCNFEPMCLE
ncbi:hypothetical protein IL306_001294 [Fusarium sp. DS 682]|nr:hypothetical protein IL306_001294 [Fusarium sp. DS 682]